jgi:hypothetical protein
MKANHMLALIAAGAVSVSGTSLRGSEADGRNELSFNKPRADQFHFSYDAIQTEEHTSAPVKERTGVRLKNEIEGRLARQVIPEAGASAMTRYSPKIELKAAQPNNVVQSGEYRHIEYSGLLVQAVRNNPLQLFNPFAPPRYGDGEANTVRSVVTGQAEGLKVLGIRF